MAAFVPSSVVHGGEVIRRVDELSVLRKGFVGCASGSPNAMLIDYAIGSARPPNVMLNCCPGIWTRGWRQLRPCERPSL